MTLSVSLSSSSMISGTGEEETILEDMIDQRDKKIRQLTDAVSIVDQRIRTTRSLLLNTVTESSRDRNEYRALCDALLLRRQKQKLECNAKNINTNANANANTPSVFLKLLQQKHNGPSASSPYTPFSLAEYTQILRRTNEPITENSPASPSNLPDGDFFVEGIQAQLCKAMHGVKILENQLDMLRRSSDGLLESIRDKIHHIKCQTSKIELQLMNELVIMDASKKKMELDYRKQLKIEEKKLEDSIANLSSYLNESSSNFNNSSIINNNSNNNNDESNVWDADSNLLLLLSDDHKSNNDSTTESVDEDLLKDMILERHEDIENLELENQRQRERMHDLAAAIRILTNELQKMG